MNSLQHFPATAEKFISHPSHAKIGINPFPDTLHVVTMLSNPLRWRSRYSNYWMFEKRVRDAGAQLYTAEIAFGGRPFEITEPGNPNHIQLRTTDEIWHKENALNLVMQRLPSTAQYISWIDADVTFQRPDWAQETMHLLQHYDFIQMFSLAHDLNVNNEVMSTHAGFMAQYANQVSIITQEITATGKSTSSFSSDGYYSGGSGGSYVYWQPGFAWAATKAALNRVGMLIDYAILGSADWHMAWALAGRVDQSLAAGLSPSYTGLVREWAARADTHIKQNVGFMPGSIYHSFHGAKAKRNYANRWQFLINTKFDPQTDIKRDFQGLWQLTDNKTALRDGIREYNRLRHEDEQ